MWPEVFFCSITYGNIDASNCGWNPTASPRWEVKLQQTSAKDPETLQGPRWLLWGLWKAIAPSQPAGYRSDFLGIPISTGKNKKNKKGWKTTELDNARAFQWPWICYSLRSEAVMEFFNTRFNLGSLSSRSRGRKPSDSGARAPSGKEREHFQWLLEDALAKSHMLQQLTGSITKLEKQCQVSCLKGQKMLPTL